jgi:FkbM family methyltransferase
VLAFEPVPRFFRRLVANCERNRLDVRCFECALSDREGEATLWDLPADHHYHASLSLDAVHSHPGLLERTVRTRTMAGVLAGEGLERLDLVKIDVEGWEPAVLKGMGPLLSHRPTILVEIKDTGRAREIERLVEGRGYLFYDLDEQGSPSRRTRLGPSRKWNWLICQPPVARALGLDG